MLMKHHEICRPKLSTHLPAQEKNMQCNLTVHLKMFPKHKIDHENIVNMGTTVNYTKGINKEALFVGCLDPIEEIKSDAELLNLEQRMHKL